MYHKILADGFFTFAAIAILVSIYGWSIEDIFLASSQWLEVAAVMLLMAIYIKINARDDELILNGSFEGDRRFREPVKKAVKKTRTVRKTRVAKTRKVAKK